MLTFCQAMLVALLFVYFGWYTFQCFWLLSPLNLCIANVIVLLSISGAQYTPFPGSKKGRPYLDNLEIGVTKDFFSSCESAIAPRMFRQSKTSIYLRCMVSIPMQCHSHCSFISFWTLQVELATPRRSS